MRRVIALSGRPGAGKSSLAKSLAARLQAIRIDYDDYETQTRLGPLELQQWYARGAPIGEMKMPGLREAILQAREKADVVLENPLGRAHEALSDIIDVSVWLDCPSDRALARKMLRLFGPDPRSRDMADQMLGFLEIYDEIVSKILDLQEERVAGLADFSISTAHSLSRSERELFEMVSNWD